MSPSVQRTTAPIRFDTGIGRTDYAEVLKDSSGSAQKPLLPGSTTVTQALDALFPTGKSVGDDIMRALVAANPTDLRTSSGFGATARAALSSLQGRGTPAAAAAAGEIETLLADGDLFEHYRMALLES